MMYSSLIELRAPDIDHFDDLYNALVTSHQEHKQFLSWAKTLPSRSRALNNLKTSIENFEKMHNDKYFHIFSRDGVFAGCISLSAAGVHAASYEIGYWLSTEHVGKGFMSDAVKLISQFAFETLNAARLEIRTSPRNKRSRAVAERAGFVFEGMFLTPHRDHGGHFCETLLFSKACS